MPKFFGRVVRVHVKPKSADGFTVDAHDIAFDVEKTQEPEPNKAKVTLYNLEAAVRHKLQLKDDAEIEIEAGYVDTVATIFKGNITYAISELQGPDIVTSIEAEEGNKAYRSSFVAKSYGPGTPFKTVVKDIVKSFDGMGVTNEITKILDGIGDSFPNGLTIDGQSAKVLNDVLRGAGLAFSIQKGQIQIVKVGGASDEPAIALGYSSGLVGVPRLGEKKEQATITFQSFIQAGLVPRRKVQLDWIDDQGEFVCQKVTHKGSNFDNEFYSTVEAFLP